MSLATLSHPNHLGDLSPREREVLALMANGRSNGGIAHDLLVSEGAVEKHVASIFTKLGLAPMPGTHRRVLAVISYLSGGFDSAAAGTGRRGPSR